MRSVLHLLILFICFSNAFATYVAVLETVAAPDVKEKISHSDRLFLTNVLREQAVAELPVEQNFTIMTRENINAMLPPGKSIEDCEGNCMVETGRNIAADYVCQMHLGSFDGELSLSAELYETAGNNLIASFNGQGSNLKELLNIIKEKSPKFFRKIKGPSSSTDVNSLGENTKTSKYQLDGRKIFSVEIVSYPTEAAFTIDGKTMHKCQSTPCKTLLEEGTHRFIASKERYDNAETIVNIREDNQKIALKLEPNFGLLMIAPKLRDNLAQKGKLNVFVDNKHIDGSSVPLTPGNHNVRVVHPCYVPEDFTVSITKQKTEIFDKTMIRGKGSLELHAEYNGNPQVVTILIDNKELGKTPYTGEVPLCAEIKLKGDGWTEKVDLTPQWHENIKKIHKLSHSPEKINLNNDATSSNTVKSIPATTENNKNKTAKWVLLGIGSTATVTGIVLAITGNSQAKNAAKKDYSSKDEFQKYRKEAASGQSLREDGLGIILLGAIGIGMSFAF